MNHYWRNVKGRTLLSEAGRLYRQAVAEKVPIGRIEGRLRVSLLCYPPDRRKRDLDNLAKGLLDALGHAGTYDDDSQIDHLEIIRGAAGAGQVVVTITRLPAELRVREFPTMKGTP